MNDSFNQVATLLSDQRKKMAQIVSLLGAFNFDVGMAFEDVKLRRIYNELVKRFALVAETAGGGAGNIFYDSITNASFEETLQKKFQYDLESIIVFGKYYGDLSMLYKNKAENLQIV